jgi:hypothetical protein
MADNSFLSFLMTPSQDYDPSRQSPNVLRMNPPEEPQPNNLLPAILPRLKPAQATNNQSNTSGAGPGFDPNGLHAMYGDSAKPYANAVQRFQAAQRQNSPNLLNHMQELLGSIQPPMGGGF